MKKLWLKFALTCMLCATQALAQNTVSGYVVDQTTGETMIGVNVIVSGTRKGDATDGNGFFRIIGLPNANLTLNFMYIGYEKKSVEVQLIDNSVVLKDITLRPKAVQMQEVVVSGKRSEIADVAIETGHMELQPRAIRSIPGSSGDVFRALKYLPGVQGYDPFSPLFSARGSDPGENMVLLDGVTIYNPYHFVTGTGLFNLYALKSIELLTGGFSAEYGGRNSAVLYITSREGNNQHLRGEMQASTSQANIVLDFPIGKNATMMVSARAFYDLVGRFFMATPNYFYDTNLSFNWKINDRNRLSGRYFYSKDYLDYSFARISTYFGSTFNTDIFDDYDLIMNTNWANQAGTIILKTVVTPKVYLKTQLARSSFSATASTIMDYQYIDEAEDDNIFIYFSSRIKNRIEDLGAKSTLNIGINSFIDLKLGAEYNTYQFNNALNINDFNQGKSSRTPNLVAGFLENKLEIKNFALRPGVRYSKFSFQEKWFAEPRVNALLNLPGHIKIKAAWGKYYQYILSINSQDYEVSQYIDNYYPLKNKAPSHSIHYILGIEKQLGGQSKFSVDFYYKDITKVYTFDLNLGQSEIINFTDKLVAGTGESYGMELMWKGKWWGYSGWMSYALSRSTRSYPHIMNGEEFLFDYDKTHSFNAVVKKQLTPAMAYTTTLQVASGAPRTIERTIKGFYHYDPATAEIAWQPSYFSEKKNNARMPWFIRLDFGFEKRLRRGFGSKLSEFFGAKNSYLNFKLGNILFFKRNPFLYFPVGEKKYVSLSSNYIPEISLGYTVKF